jgi:formate dehydrogenase iron-sulfur subunit
MNEKYGTLVPLGRLVDDRLRTIVYDATKCIGCRQCVHACKDWHDHARTTVFTVSSTNWMTMEPPMLEGMSPLWARNSCMHCEFPTCAAICPVEAITKCEEGPLVIDKDRCVGCEYCIYACPWGVIAKDDLTSKASKCDMCSDRVKEGKSPFCVQACPVSALDFGLHEEIAPKAKARAAEVGGYLYGEKEAAGTQVFCILAERKEAYGVRPLGTEKYIRRRVPASLMIKDVFTLRLGVSAKLRALSLAIIHPRRLLFRYWPADTIS